MNTQESQEKYASVQARDYLTKQYSFYPTRDRNFDEVCLFSVNEGVEIIEALEAASAILDLVSNNFHDDFCNDAWINYHLAGQAAAIVSAVVSGLYKQGSEAAHV